MSTNESTELKIYEVHNRSTGEKHLSVATNTQQACNLAEWQIGDCFIVELKPRRQPAPGQETLLLVTIPCQTCPFQYAECRKPPDKDCPCKPKTPDLQRWLVEEAQAHLCDFVGASLKIKDYNLQRKWLPMDKAIEELTHKA